MRIELCGAAFEVDPALASLFGQDRAIMSRHWDVRPGDVCLDVGSGPGTWTLVALAKGARTFSFDPRPLAARMLLDQIILNGFTRGIVLPFGLFGTSSVLPFSEDLGSFRHGALSGRAPVVALDEFLEVFPLDRLDFMNLDVEASEREVLQGARGTIKRFKPKIIIEVHEGVPAEDLEREISMSAVSYAFTREAGFLMAEWKTDAHGLAPALPAAAAPVTNLYLTHDVIGTPSGGGVVTMNEYKAFASLSVKGAPCPMDGLRLANHADPIEADRMVLRQLQNLDGTGRIGRVHLYAGCFSETIRWLQERGSLVTYTAAAHDIAESRREFEELGIPYDFPHLTEPELWKRYVAGYLAADVVVCPSMLSRRIMESYGAKRVEVIPHGCNIPRETAPPPARFVVGFLGQAGPDKGLRYLFQAWKNLALKDGLLLVAGNNIDQALPLWRRFGGGNVEFMGFVKDIDDFFARISVYCQPSVSEGFGIEVLEAMAHARPVVVSTGAGAADVVPEGAGLKGPPRDAGWIAQALEVYRSKPELAVLHGSSGRENAGAYDWERIRAQYISLWKSLGREDSP